MTVETWLEELSEPICQWHLAHAALGRAEEVTAADEVERITGRRISVVVMG